MEKKKNKTSDQAKVFKALNHRIKQLRKMNSALRKAKRPPESIWEWEARQDELETLRDFLKKELKTP